MIPLILSLGKAGKCDRYSLLLCNQFDNIKEIRCENVNIPLFTDIVHEAQSLYGKLREPFMWNREKIPSRKHELTATFSRDKEYL